MLTTKRALHHNHLKWILSFFLVLGALVALGQYRATAYADDAGTTGGADRILDCDSPHRVCHGIKTNFRL